MVAAIVCAALMVSCGGEKKADPVVAKAQEMAAKMKNVTSEAEAMAVAAPYLKYYDSLSEADQEKFDKAVEAALKVAEAPEAEVAEPVAATSGATTVAEPVQAIEVAEPVAEPVQAVEVAEPVAEPVEAEVSPAVKAKATEYANKMVAAIKAGDMEKAEKIDAEANAWFEKLSEVEQMQAGEIVAKIASAAGLE